MKKVLSLPGWMTALRLYKDDIDDFDVYFGGLDEKSFSADYVVGLSLGAIIALYNIEKIKGKVILVNPPLPKRSLFRWLLKWVKYMVKEGLFLKRQKLTINPIRYTKALTTCIKLLSIDFSNILDNVPKDKITVIRGKDDRFFCDELAVNFLKSKNIKVIEVKGGHNWSEEIEETMNNLIV